MKDKIYIFLSVLIIFTAVNGYAQGGISNQLPIQLQPPMLSYLVNQAIAKEYERMLNDNEAINKYEQDYNQATYEESYLNQQVVIQGAAQIDDSANVALELQLNQAQSAQLNGVSNGT